MSVHTDHAAQQAIDDEIKELKERLRTLLTRRNSYAAISHLPNEIMTQIFTACRAQSPKYTSHTAIRTLLRISTVCSHWRNIALGAGQLWSLISLDDAPYLTLALLRRSKSAPLTVTFPPGAYNSSDSRANILSAILAEETHRFEDVAFHTDPTNISPLISRLLPMNGDPRAPLLRSLVLESDIPHGAQEPPHMLARFWTDLRSLRTLRLRHTLPMDIVIPPMPVLTRLTIHTARISHLHQLSASWVLKLLRETPLIESVDIRTISSDDTTTTSTRPAAPAVDPIDLPQLTSIALTFASIQDSKLVEFITFPSTTCVSLTYDNDISDPGLQVQLGSLNATSSQPIRTLKHLISRLSNTALSSTDTHTHTDTDTDAHTSTDPKFIDVYIAIFKIERLEDSEFEMEISVPTSSSPRSQLSLYILLQRFPPLTRKHANIAGSLPLDRIRDLILHIYEPGAGEDVAGWCGILRYLVSLKSLTVDRVGVLRGLAPSANGTTSSSSSSLSSNSNSSITSTSMNSHLPTPDLKTLVIHQDPTATPDDWTAFIQTCRLRSLQGAPKLDIRIHVRDNLDDDDWERVRSGGVDVDVEGLSQYAKVELEWEEDEE